MKEYPENGDLPAFQHSHRNRKQGDPATLKSLNHTAVSRKNKRFGSHTVDRESVWLVGTNGGTKNLLSPHNSPCLPAYRSLLLHRSIKGQAFQGRVRKLGRNLSHA